MSGRHPALMAACIIVTLGGGCALPPAALIKVGDVNGEVVASARLVLGTARFETPPVACNIDVMAAAPARTVEAFRVTTAVEPIAPKVVEKAEQARAEPSETKGESVPGQVKGTVQEEGVRGRTAPSGAKGTVVMAPAKGQSEPGQMKGETGSGASKGLARAEGVRGDIASHLDKGVSSSEGAKGRLTTRDKRPSSRLQSGKSSSRLGVLEARIEVTKVADHSSMLPDDRVVFTVTAVNRSPMPIRDVVITDTYCEDLKMVKCDTPQVEVRADDGGGGTVLFQPNRILAVNESVRYQVTCVLTEKAKAKFAEAVRHVQHEHAILPG